MFALLPYRQTLPPCSQNRSAMGPLRRCGWPLYTIVYTSLLVVSLTHGAQGGGSPVAAEDPPTFNEQVRPILSNHCFACHGPDEDHREAGLRLDLPDEADWEEVVSRIRSDDADVRMPPPHANKPLDAEQINTLGRWVEAGANYEEHWAFVAPVAAAVPQGVHPIDHFVDQRLTREGLARAPAADPLLLIRRLYLDLIGLPPSVAQADAFAADPSPEAYGQIVDELLQRDEYGERWARRWLDLARYADTNGYEKDRDRSMWPYRDWVIDAINDGMPFDRFTIEQLAGDMLPGAGPQQRVATGFHRNTMLNEEGGIDPMEFRYHAMTDRVATTGTTWLGLTTGCAQCHTHKYDPITHRDYFGMMALLNNVDEPDYFIRSEQSLEHQASQWAKADKILLGLESHWPEPESSETAGESSSGQDAPSENTFVAAFSAWWSVTAKQDASWATIEPTAVSANVPYLMHEDDGIIFAGGDTSKHDIYSLAYPGSKAPITAIRLEALPDQRLPKSGPGSTYYEGPKGDFFLSELEIETAAEDSGTEPQRIGIAGASQSYAKNHFGSNPATAEMACDGDLQTGWSASGRPGLRHIAVFVLEKPIPAGTPLNLRMHFGRHFASSLGKFRVSVTNATGEKPRATLLATELLQSLDVDAAKANREVRKAFLLGTEELEKTARQWVSLRSTPPGTPTLVMRERPPEHPRPTFLHRRGEYTQPTEQVSPRVPDVLRWAGDASPTNRLEFARWIVARDNPLTARVVANRAWAAFFGNGIVNTVTDFGMQGSPPSHPQLLDYLAVDLMDGGWDVKQLHRLIVTSATYQQSSRIDPSNDDPRAGVLLSRFPRKRLDAEVIRDVSLAAAGLLESKMHGPPVRPPQPAAAQAANYAKSNWHASEGADRYRRGIYTYQQRTAPFAMFATFDAGSGESCLARRDVSNTPLQSLTLMNDPMFIEIAEHFGSEMADAAGDDRDRIRLGFRRLLTRCPSPSEIEMLTAFHQQHHDWAATARVLLCLDESITKN
ncbi:PSD1 and planctomycete cytochrome C domain-containing protein [Allorhodopirellula solitaria]|uniref:Planctomycete cytochrome C n=1 Tax=Allorhodopirellula solitaria TaxID=2527987 RepID=A0A5C5X8K7_9BACT|nr:PSD1 and planctomycete cytochrome C domain-containing protein [Allorhodopirellula solitaria]TWT59204.1 Planctomycete cytochrome C [Allorhodopirellula solitaria]